jgi:hypothetical protein
MVADSFLFKWSSSIIHVTWFHSSRCGNQKEDGDALQFNKDVHHKAGLAIFILVFIQAFSGYVRPSPLPPPSSSSPNNVITNSKSSSDRDIPNKTNTTFVKDDAEELSHQQKQQAYDYF